MQDVAGLAREILEIRPPCLEVQVSCSVEVFFTDCSGCSGSASLVLLHKDALLKNITIRPQEKLARFDFEVKSPGIISVVIITEEKDSTVHISSVAPLPVLPSPAAQELQKIFENTLEAAKSIVLHQQSNPKGGEQQYLLVAGHKLSLGQEQAIRHMLWKERFRPFAVDLEFLLDSPPHEEPTSPSYEESCTEENELMTPVSCCNSEENKVNQAAVVPGNAEWDVMASSVLAPTKQPLCPPPTTDPLEAETGMTRCYEMVLRGMLKFLSSCDAWSCFMYVMKECTSRGVLFTGMDQLGVSEVGLQCLYELAPQSMDCHGSTCVPHISNRDGAELLGSAEAQTLVLEGIGSCGVLSSEGGCNAPKPSCPLDNLPPKYRKSSSPTTAHASEYEPLQSKMFAVLETTGRAPPLPLQELGARPGSLHGAGEPMPRRHIEESSASTSGRGPAGNSEAWAPEKQESCWDPSFRKMLRKSSSMPVRLDQKLGTHPTIKEGFSSPGLRDARNLSVQEGCLAAFWPTSVLQKPAHTPTTSSPQGVHYLPGIEGLSLSLCFAVGLWCFWLYITGVTAHEGLNLGAFCLGLSGLLIGVLVVGRFLSNYSNQLVVVSRTVLVFVLLLRASGMVDCPCIPSWNREGHCMLNILQSLFWLTLTAIGVKTQLWRDFGLLALEIGAFLLALSRNDGRCHSSNWVIAGPALLGEMYSVVSTALQQQSVFGVESAGKNKGV